MKALMVLKICLFSIFFLVLLGIPIYAEDIVSGTDNVDMGAILRKNPGEVTQEDCLAAIKYFGEQAELNPSSAEAHYYLGLAYCLSERYLEASKALEQAVSLSPDFPPPYYLLCFAYKKLDRQSESQQTFLKAIDVSMNYTQDREDKWRLWWLRKIIE